MFSKYRCGSGLWRVHTRVREALLQQMESPTSVPFFIFYICSYSWFTNNIFLPNRTKPQLEWLIFATCLSSDNISRFPEEMLDKEWYFGDVANNATKRHTTAAYDMRMYQQKPICQQYVSACLNSWQDISAYVSTSFETKRLSSGNKIPYYIWDTYIFNLIF